MFTLKDYVVAEKIGGGTYGDVYKAHRKTGSREVVAIKAVLKNKLSKPETDNLIREISLLKKLKQHPHIVEMKDFLWDNKFIYIIMEYCGGGDLSKFIKTRNSLPENVVKTFLQQLSLALQFLHSQNLSHMDLKPQNILLSHNKTLKLCDFGFAKKLSGSETSLIGSPLYMAPEIILDRKYDAKVDLWSVGVILFECLFGKAPYKSDTVDELLTKIKTGQPILIPRNPKISDHCRDLLNKCLERDPQKRISFPDYFRHPFLDLDHAPTPENYTKALSIIDRAVHMDKSGNLKEALKLYNDALDYFVPLYHAEMNSVKKSSLRKRIDEYIHRAETLKLNTSPSSSLNENTNLIFTNNLDDYDELVDLSKGNPGIITGLEIAHSAELYEREGQFKLALEKYETSLGILIPLLAQEPSGKNRRKTLFKNCVNKWMNRAEMTKKLLNIQEEELSAHSTDKHSIATSPHDKCLIS